MTTATDLDLPFLDTHDAAYQADPTDAYREAFARGWWLVRTPEGFGILSYRDAEAILHHAGFGVFFSFDRSLSPFLHERTRGNILSLRDEHHTRLRRLAWPAFRPRSMDVWRDHMRRVMSRLVDRVQEAGLCDFVADISEPYPVLVTSPILGIPLEEGLRLAPLSHDWIKIFDFPHHRDNVKAIEAAWAQLEASLDEVIAFRRRHPGNDLLTELIRAQDAGDRLTHEELLQLLVALFVGALDTTRHQMSLAVADFLAHPDQWETLRSSPEVLPLAVEEVLRYTSTIHTVGRVPLRDVEYRGVTFPRESVVLIFVRAVNRDPAAFREPDRFDIMRRSEHVSFGGGPHYCIGAPLARVEMAEGLGVLAERWSSVEPAGEPRYLPVTGNLGATSLPIRFRSVP
jgi:cytochrome P450